VYGEEAWTASAHGACPRGGPIGANIPGPIVGCVGGLARGVIWGRPEDSRVVGKLDRAAVRAHGELGVGKAGKKSQEHAQMP